MTHRNKRIYWFIGGLLLVTVFLSAQTLPVELATVSQSKTYQSVKNLERVGLSSIHPQDLLTIDSALLLPDVPYRNHFFLLAGWLGRREALQAVPYEYRRSARMQNDYDLAMIRAGDDSRIRRLQTLLSEATVDDEFIYTIADKLIYTRRPEVFDFMMDQILLDQQNCSTADTHGGGRINCAYRLLEMIAPHIEDFPLDVGPSGDLTIDDYEEALATARRWIQENRANYFIITETY